MWRANKFYEWNTAENRPFSRSYGSKVNTGNELLMVQSFAKIRLDINLDGGNLGIVARFITVCRTTLNFNQHINTPVKNKTAALYNRLLAYTGTNMYLNSRSCWEKKMEVWNKALYTLRLLNTVRYLPLGFIALEFSKSITKYQITAAIKPESYDKTFRFYVSKYCVTNWKGIWQKAVLCIGTMWPQMLLLISQYHM